MLIAAAAGGRGQRRRADRGGHRARPLGVASPPNRDYLESLGASEVFDYHAVGWAPGAVRDSGRAIFLVLQSPPAQLERGITGESLAAHVDRQRLEQRGRLVDVGQLRPQVGAVLPLEQVREVLARVAAGTRAA